MKKLWLSLSFVLLLVACQLFAPATPTAAPPLPALTTVTSAPIVTAALPTPTVPPTPPLPAGELPWFTFAPGEQPNGSFVIHSIQQRDLTGDGREDFVIVTGWKLDAADEFTADLQVDILNADGTLLYTQNTWEAFGNSPSTMDLEAYSFIWLDRIESVDIVSLTDSPVPQVVVRVRYSGTGSILEAHILSFAGGVTQTLADIVAYKGWLEYRERGYIVSQPLYLYNEPNCCPCRMETVTYLWDGTAFTVAETLREAIAEMENCPAFPTPAEWRALTVGGPAPPPRRDAALVYEAQRERLWLFGGRQATTALNDTWVFDLKTATWRELPIPAAARPAARYGMVAGLDALRGQFFIMAGTSQPGVFLNDVWALDLEAELWVQQAPGGSGPGPRVAAGGIPDYSNTLLLTHGCTAQGYLDDTWVLDLETLIWRNVTPGGALPLKRCWHSAAPLGWTQLVLFGGCSTPLGPCPQGDTWLFDLNHAVWRALDGPAPTPRQYAGLVSLGDRGAVLLFGGLGVGEVELGDAWILVPGERGWRQVTPSNAGPAPRQGHSMAWLNYSPLAPGGAVAIFGGASGGTLRNDLWVFIPWDE